MTSETAMRAFVRRFFDAIENGDLETVRASYAPHVKVWHNTDETVTSRDENVETLKGFVERIPSRRYENRRVQVFEGGFVQQHDLRGVRADGVELVLPACIVCEVENGLIVRLDEYVDSARVAQFRGG